MTASRVGMTMKMTAKEILGTFVLLGLVALGAGPIDGAEPGAPGDRVGNQIVVVNQSVTPVRVFVEDSEGRSYELGNLDRGETRMFEAPAEFMERGDFQVRVRPRQYAQRFSDPVSITTGALDIDDGEAVILWLDRDLARSKVEVRG